LVTAHRICFNRIREREGERETIRRRDWGVAEWEFFLDDVRRRLLEPDGRLLLEFNLPRDGSAVFGDELRAFFVSEGARIFRAKALFAANRSERPRFKRTKR
jgi:hypothetical protein